MNKAITIAFVLLNVAFASAVFLPNVKPTINIMTQIQQIDQTEFGTKLMDTIALQLGNNAPLGDVADLLKGIMKDLIKQQNAHDKLWAQQSAECKKMIFQYRADIKKFSGIVRDAVSRIFNLKRRIRWNIRKIRNFKKQLIITAARLVSLQKAHAKDLAAFKKRTAEHQSVLAALDVIIPKLQSIKAAPKKPHGVFLELAQLGDSNPIAALVALSSGLNMKALRVVIRKLKKIRTAIAVSLKSDAAWQAASNKEFASMVAEIGSLKASLTRQLNAENQDLFSNKNNLKIQRKRRNDNRKLWKAAASDLKNKKNQCANWRAVYKKDTAQRSSEKHVVRKVIHIVASRLNTMKSYLKKRVNK